MRHVSRPALVRTIIVALAALVAVVALIVFSNRTPPDPWSGPEMAVSEKAYTAFKFSRLLNNWKETGGSLLADPHMEQPPSYDVCLVIDLDKRAMWIEEGGEVMEGQYLELSEKMKWRLYYADHFDISDPGSIVRMKLRGLSQPYARPEKVLLVGESPTSGHMELKARAYQHGYSIGDGKYPGPQVSSSEWSHGPSSHYPSFIVTQEEYDEARSAVEAADGPRAAERKQGGWEQLDLTRWREVEKSLFREIERKVNSRRFSVSQIVATLGPDGTAGHAVVDCPDNDWLRRVAGFRRIWSFVLTFEHIGEGVWHLKTDLPSSSRLPARELPRPELPRRLHLDFFVAAKGEAAKPPKGWSPPKARDSDRADEPNRFTATLANGATVEVVGLAEHASAGKQWWRPDGTPLEAEPYFDPLMIETARPGQKLFETVWRVTWPPGAGSHQTSGSWSAMRYIRPKDRFGLDVPGINVELWSFDEGLESTKMEIGIGMDKQAPEWVRFGNISLVPGNDPGFEIVPFEPEE